MGLAFFFNNRFGRFLSPSFQLSKDDFIPKCFLSLQNVLATHPPTPPHAELSFLHFAVHFKWEIDGFFSAESLEQGWPDFQLHMSGMESGVGL